MKARKQARSARISRKTLLVGGIMMSLCLSLSCLKPEMVLEGFLALDIWPQDEEIRYLRLQVALCEGDTIRSGPWQRERPIDLPLGSERFYLPEFGAGEVDLWIEGYPAAPERKADGQAGEAKKHLRLRFLRRDAEEALPTVFLQEGRATKESALCQRPSLPQIPTDPQAWLVGATVAGGIGGRPWWSQGLEGRGGAAQEDRLRGEESFASPFPLQEMATDGRLLAGVFVRGGGGAEIGLFELPEGRFLQSLPLPDGCNPKGMDLQGGILAITCPGMHRLLLWSVGEIRRQGRWSRIGPVEGWAVGLEPIDVRLSGTIAAVVLRGSQEIAFVDLKKMEILPKTIRVGESPRSISSVNRTFFVANEGSNSVSIFAYHAEGSVVSEIPYKVASKPSKVVANAWFWVTAHPEERSLTVYERQTGRSRSLPLSVEPGDIQLLSDQLLVLDRKSAAIQKVDLRQMAVTSEFREEKAGPMLQIQIAGDMIVASDPAKAEIRRFSFSGRPGFRLWRSGSIRQWALEGSSLWLLDGAGSRFSEVDLATGDRLQQIDLQGGAWLRNGYGWFVHTGAKPWQVVIRSVGSPQTIAFQRDLPRPICGGEILGSTLYLFHCSEPSEGELRPASWTTIDVKALHSGLWDQKEGRFPEGSQTPVGLLAWKGYLLLIDQRQRRLWCLDETSLQPLRTMELPGAPLQILILPTGEVALLLETGEVFVASADRFLSAEALPKPLILDIFPGEMAWSPGRLDSLWISDRRGDRVLRLHLPSRLVVERSRVGADPFRLLLWKDHAILANFGSEDLSLLPLSP